MVIEPKLEIRHLMLVATVAETGSVTEAGKRLHLTQSALSHQLRDAEDRLGTALFLRLGKKMALTSAGETLLVSTRRVLEELAGAEKQIAGANSGTRGVIRVSTECYTCYHWLPSLMNKFQRRFPGVEIMVHPDVTGSAVNELLEGKLDVTISAIPRPNAKLRAMPLFEDEMVVVMSRRHRLAKVKYLRPTDLENETILIYPPRSDSTLLGIVMEPAGVKPRRVIEIPLTEGLIELAAAGIGVGMVAEWAVMPELRAKKVVAKSVGPQGVNRNWCALTLRGPAHPAYLTAFLELLKAATPFQGRKARPTNLALTDHSGAQRVA